MKINVTPEEFTSIIFLYLLDKINRPEEVGPHGESFDEIFEKLNQLKSHLARFFLSTDINNRIYYKRIRDVFVKEEFNTDYVIRIVENDLNESINEETQDQENSANDFYRIKDIVKKTISSMNKRKFYKGSYISEAEMDKIIEKIIEREIS